MSDVHVKVFVYNILTNHHKAGDKIYVNNRIIANTNFSEIQLYELVRPMTEVDVEAMDIPLWQKVLIKKDLNPLRRPCMIESKWSISCDSLRKMHTAVAGSYIDQVGQDWRVGLKKFYISFFGIHPNKKALINTYISKDLKIPDGYIATDGPFYVMPFEVDGVVK